MIMKLSIQRINGNSYFTLEDPKGGKVVINPKHFLIKSDQVIIDLKKVTKENHLSHCIFFEIRLYYNKSD